MRHTFDVINLNKVYLSFDPSGKMPGGTSTNSFCPTKCVSQVTCMHASKAILKHKFEVTSASVLAGEVFLSSKGWCRPLASTKGSFKTPTPLPSAFLKDTLAAWGTSGTPQRPGTQLYAHSFYWHAAVNYKQSTSYYQG